MRCDCSRHFTSTNTVRRNPNKESFDKCELILLQVKQGKWHTVYIHTYIHTYIYIYISVCVYPCLSLHVCPCHPSCCLEVRMQTEGYAGYGELMSNAMGVWGRRGTNIFIVLLQSGICCTYFIVACTLLQSTVCPKVGLNPSWFA